MRIARSLAAVLAFSTLTLAGAAQAQEKERGADKPIEYRFSDDPMLGTTLSSNLAILKLNIHPGRVTLLRPRASFVSEMLTSVETM